MRRLYRPSWFLRPALRSLRNLTRSRDSSKTRDGRRFVTIAAPVIPTVSSRVNALIAMAGSTPFDGCRNRTIFGNCHLKWKRPYWITSLRITGRVSRNDDDAHNSLQNCFRNRAPKSTNTANASLNGKRRETVPHPWTARVVTPVRAVA